MRKIIIITTIVSFMLAVLAYANCQTWEPGDSGTTPIANPKPGHAATGPLEICPTCLAQFVLEVLEGNN